MAIDKTATTGSIREELESREETFLHPLAARSRLSAGRPAGGPAHAGPPCPLRTAFQQDRDRILHSRAFRRLKHKTQVFIAPVDDHLRTRLTHSLEVAQVARTVARALRLNEDLTEAIALGHDLGHPPFGHLGEEVLNDCSPTGFRHERQNVRIARILEPMNLTAEVLDGMGAQLETAQPTTLEAAVVKIADRITYLHHDVEDAIRAGLMSESDLPADLRRRLGDSRGSRLEVMVFDLVETSRDRMDRRQAPGGTGRIGLSPDIQTAMNQLRRWMFRHVYLGRTQQEQKTKVRRVLGDLFGYFCDHPEAISPTLPTDPEDPSLERRGIDYLAGMTDRFALETYNRCLLPGKPAEGLDR